MVQLAVFVLQRWGKRVAPALAEARLQAFRYLEREGVVEALQQAAARRSKQAAMVAGSLTALTGDGHGQAAQASGHGRKSD
jgi:hypothetical protein